MIVVAYVVGYFFYAHGCVGEQFLCLAHPDFIYEAGRGETCIFLEGLPER